MASAEKGKVIHSCLVDSTTKSACYPQKHCGPLSWSLLAAWLEAMNATDPSILIAVADPTLRTEATHIAAATGHRVLTANDERDISRLATRAAVLFIDSVYAQRLAGLSTSTRPARWTNSTYLLFLDPGPNEDDFVDELIEACDADECFVIPAQNKNLLKRLGADARRRETDAPAAELRDPHRLAPGPVRPPTRRLNPAARSPQPVPTVAAASAPPHLTIAVIATGGGAGASTLAAAIARVAAQEYAGAVTLIDAVAYSGGIDLLLGVEKHDGLRWPDLNLGEGHIAASDLRSCLPTTDDGIAVLTERRASEGTTSFRDHEVIETVLSALQGEPGLSVVDAHPSHIPRAIDAAVLVCPAELRCAARAEHLSAQLSAEQIPSCLVVRHRQWSSLSVEDIENLVRSDVIAEIGTIRGLTKTTESGGLPSHMPKPLSIISHAVLAEYR